MDNLDIKLKKQCLYCGGKGYTFEMGEEICVACMGSGRDIKSNLWHKQCSICNGKNTVSYCRKKICLEC